MHNFFFYNFPHLKDVAARAYIGKENVTKAIAEYAKLFTFNPDSEDRFLIHPKNHLRIT